MPRLLGIDIPDNKRLEIALTYLFGIGRHRSKEIIAKMNLDPSMKAKDLRSEDIAKLNNLLTSEYILEGDLRRQVQNNIKRLVSIHCYRGIRHRLSLPVRGQRTKSNSRTRKGKKRTVAGKKLSLEKK